MISTPNLTYVGRFAPSPSGPLHFGSLIAALASYLDARHAQGRWLLRIEDLDPPRQQAGAAAAILRCLEAHQLYWDGKVLYQSQRQTAYWEALQILQAGKLIYPCFCTRKALAAIGGPYPGTCRRLLPAASNRAAALRLLTEGPVVTEQNLQVQNCFDDLLLGLVDDIKGMGDFIVKRKDGLFAYQLAVVVDDIFQGVNHVIRGTDLLACTPAQMFLFRCLHATPPQFGHIPLALNEHKQKLSKQHGAKAIDNSASRENIVAALQFLDHAPPDAAAMDIPALLRWAIAHWDRRKVSRHNQVVNDV